MLSTSAELRLGLHCGAILYGNLRADLGVTSGVQTAEDVLTAMIAEASAATMASALLAHGIEHLAHVHAHLTRGFLGIAPSVRQMGYVGGTQSTSSSVPLLGQYRWTPGAISTACASRWCSGAAGSRPAGAGAAPHRARRPGARWADRAREEFRQLDEEVPRRS